jgi:hypothetical protein
VPRKQTYYFSVVIFLCSTTGFEQWRVKKIKLVEVIFVSIISIVNGSVLFSNQKCQYKIFHIIVRYACWGEASSIAVIGDDLHYFTQTHWTTWHLQKVLIPDDETSCCGQYSPWIDFHVVLYTYRCVQCPIRNWPLPRLFPEMVL